MKLLKITLLLILLFLNCVTGPPRTRIQAYNKKNEVINITFKLTNMKDFKSHEVTYNVMANSNRPLDNHTGLHKPASKVYEYVIIKDENDNELMNLRGEILNNAVTIEVDNEDHVIYRLDVN